MRKIMFVLSLLLGLCSFQSCEPKETTKSVSVNDFPVKMYVIGVDSNNTRYNGKYYVYYLNKVPNARDTVLIVKEYFKPQASYHFGDTLTLK